jgi:hypothetical protein
MMRRQNGGQCAESHRMVSRSDPKPRRSDLEDEQIPAPGARRAEVSPLAISVVRVTACQQQRPRGSPRPYGNIHPSRTDDPTLSLAERRPPSSQAARSPGKTRDQRKGPGWRCDLTNGFWSLHRDSFERLVSRGRKVAKLANRSVGKNDAVINARVASIFWRVTSANPSITEACRIHPAIARGRPRTPVLKADLPQG